MKCPFCQANNDRVVDSREAREGAIIRRRRECIDCGRRFTSYEQIDEIPYLVVKKDGQRQDFNPNKLLGGLRRASEKRPVSAQELEQIVASIEAELHQRQSREIHAQEIGNLVMDRLRELDQVAYVRFASVYRRFEDIGAFMEEVRNLQEEPESLTPK